MALHWMRKNQKVIMMILAVAIALMFGIGSTVSFLTSVAGIPEDDIFRNDFRHRWGRCAGMASGHAGTFLIKNQAAFEELAVEAHRMRVGVSDDEIKDAFEKELFPGQRPDDVVARINHFAGDFRFDRTQLERFVFDYVRIRKLLGMRMSAIGISPLEQALSADMAVQTRTLAIAIFEPDELKDMIDVPESFVKEEFDLGSDDRYVRYQIEYVYAPEDVFADMVHPTAEELEWFYEENLETFGYEADTAARPGGAGDTAADADTAARFMKFAALDEQQAERVRTNYVKDVIGRENAKFKLDNMRRWIDDARLADTDPVGEWSRAIDRHDALTHGVTMPLFGQKLDNVVEGMQFSKFADSLIENVIEGPETIGSGRGAIVYRLVRRVPPESLDDEIRRAITEHYRDENALTFTEEMAEKFSGDVRRIGFDTAAERWVEKYPFLKERIGFTDAIRMPFFSTSYVHFDGRMNIELRDTVYKAFEMMIGEVSDPVFDRRMRAGGGFYTVFKVAFVGQVPIREQMADFEKLTNQADIRYVTFERADFREQAEKLISSADVLKYYENNKADFSEGGSLEARIVYYNVEVPGGLTEEFEPYVEYLRANRTGDTPENRRNFLAWYSRNEYKNPLSVHWTDCKDGRALARDPRLMVLDLGKTTFDEIRLKLTGKFGEIEDLDELIAELSERERNLSPMRFGPDAAFFVEITARSAGAARPFDEVKDVARALLISIKARELMVNKAREAYEKLKGGNFEKVAGDLGYDVRHLENANEYVLWTNLGLHPTDASLVFGAGPGKIVGELKSEDGSKVCVTEMLKLKKVDPAEASAVFKRNLGVYEQLKQMSYTRSLVSGE